MKMKLTTLLFSLLLAVGWTSNAFAQSETFSAESIKDLRYTWTDAQGTSHSEPYVVYNAEKDAWEAPEVHNAYQIYGLLRGVYMEPALPGPKQSAYDKNGNREDDIFYGGCDNGWNIPGTYTTSGTTYSSLGNLTINFTNNSSGYRIYFSEIRIVSGNTLIASWNRTSSATLPTGWSRSGSWSYEDFGDTRFAYFSGNSGSITIQSSVFQGYDNVEVVVTAIHPYFNTYYGTMNVNGNDTQTISDYGDYAWNFNRYGHKNFASDTYMPEKDGYTAIAVALKNTPFIESEPGLQGSTSYSTPDEVINYIAQNIEYVKLLTDGLRITDQAGNPGTVFNCDGTYNKFFFLGKGKARTKGAEVQNRIKSGAWADHTGECIIFWPLFEEFSPTTGTLSGASTIVDFYDRMMEGSVYDVVHDCAGVIQNRHEFTLAGEDKTDDYPFTGLNFFIPDYRLKYWVGKDSVQNSDGYTYIDVDGRDMNALYNTAGQSFRRIEPYYANYAVYNPDYAPKVGLYKISLSAVATFVGDPDNPNHQPGNQNYVVTLKWISSLNEMAGYDVPQTYTVYYWDPKTGERKYVEAVGITDGKTHVTTISYLVDQEEHSYTIEYIVMGTPDDSDHPNFVAWSNRDNVVIPGWDDFVGLQLDHHESDFVVAEMANYYRNFLEVVNEDIYNGLTVSKIENGMNTFTLYRYTFDENNQPKDYLPIATVTFGTPNANGTVPYTVSYIEDQVLLETPKYSLGENYLNIPLTGVVRVKGNGDLVIWPNSYHVNFKSITVYDDNNNVVTSWNYTQNNLPSTWIVSPGSEWETFNNDGDQVGYMEGGGYIAIPNIVNNSNYEKYKVEIVAYGDGASVARITVNDRQQTIANGTAATYIWGGNGLNEHPLSPYAAPKRDNDGSNSTPNALSTTPKSKPVGTSNSTTNSNVPFNKTNKR